MEEQEVEGTSLLQCVKDLAEEGDVCRVVIENAEGRTLMEVPLATGLGVGGAVALLSPVATGIAAMGALLSKVKVKIERVQDDVEA
jgi:hypothetical protein